QQRLVEQQLVRPVGEEMAEIEAVAGVIDVGGCAGLDMAGEFHGVEPRGRRRRRLLRTGGIDDREQRHDRQGGGRGKDPAHSRSPSQVLWWARAAASRAARQATGIASIAVSAIALQDSRSRSDAIVMPSAACRRGGGAAAPAPAFRAASASRAYF